MIETILISFVSVFGFCFGCVSLVKYTYNYAVNENRKTLIDLNRMITYRLKNEELKGILDSEEVKTLKILKKEIENFLIT
jgi:hypothetical protein